jgi:hypothetical protein
MLVLTFPAYADEQSVNQSIQELRREIDELKMQKDLEYFSFGGTLINRYDHVNNYSKPADRAEYFDFFRLQFSLNMAADISKRLQFYGRYTTSKYYNQYNSQPYMGTGTTAGGTHDNTRPTPNDPLRDMRAASTYDSGPVSYLERAYFNFKFSEDTIFSAGRLPTSNGPPAQWQEGVAREGTYARMGFSANYDGVAIKQNMVNNSENEFSGLLLFTPWSEVNDDGIFTDAIKNRQVAANGDVINSYHNVYAIILDYKNKGSDNYNNLNVIGQMLHQDIKPSDGGGFHIDYKAITLYAAVEDLMRSGFDLSLTYATTISKSTGQANFGSGPVGWLTNDNEATSTGKSYLAQVRYKINSKDFNFPFVGFEFVQGDKYFQFDEFAARDLANFYAVRGSASHLYYLQTVENLKIRLGYSVQNQDYGSTFFDYWGEPTKNEAKISNFYVNTRLDF